MSNAEAVPPGNHGNCEEVRQDRNAEAVFGSEGGAKARPLWFAVYAGVLTAAFGWSLGSLALHALEHELHSHIVLIPFVTAYLVYQKRSQLPKRSRPLRAGVVLFALAGMGLLALALAARGESMSYNDRLGTMVGAYLCLLAAGAFGLVGRAWMKALAFPAFFLVFMVPLPDSAVVWIEQALQVASAEAADLIFGLIGTTAYREGQVFQLPGMTIRVAQECSGIRSSWVLMITGLLASYMFLRSPWRRAVLVFAIIPLGIIRNGLRVVVIGLVCVRYGPHMIDSVIHRHGGPFFFALSLVPLFALLWWLRRGERERGDVDGQGENETRTAEAAP